MCGARRLMYRKFCLLHKTVYQSLGWLYAMYKNIRLIGALAWRASSGPTFRFEPNAAVSCSGWNTRDMHARSRSFNIINKRFPPLWTPKNQPSIPIWIYHLQKLYTSCYVSEEPNQPTKYSERATMIQVTIHERARFFEKKMLGSEDFSLLPGPVV